MKTAHILYNSKTGTTEKYAREIGAFLEGHGVTALVESIFACDPEKLTQANVVLLGCWTSGLMVIFQRPERTWVEFARTLPDLHGKKILLFTTYALATGSMFREMRKHLRCESKDILMELKSRNGELNPIQKDILTKLIKENL